MGIKNIPALTGLRLFAALAIVLWHSQTGYFFAVGAFSPFFLAGAVPVFFLLSGFVLTIASDRYKSWPDFYVARFARIWPAHIAAMIFLFTIFYPYSLSFFYDRESLKQLGLNIILLQDWSPNKATYWSYNAVAWSLSCEAFFYAAFPVLLMFMRRRPVFKTCAATAFIFCGVMGIGRLFPGIDHQWLGGLNPLVSLIAFLAGICVGQRYRDAGVSHQGLVVSSAIQAGLLATALIANAAFSVPGVQVAKTVVWFGAYVAPVPFYAIFLLSLARYDGMISRFLSKPTIVYGGEMSFSMYLFHQLIFRWHSQHLRAFSELPNWLQYVCIITLIFGISSASYHGIEKPSRRIILVAWKFIGRSHLGQPVEPSKSAQDPHRVRN